MEVEKTVSRMQLNVNKAGMEGLDKEKVNKIILDASKGSRFYENQKKQEEHVNHRIENMMSQLRRVTEEQKLQALTKVDLMVQEIESLRDLSYTIVHVDMDAFYASVEIRDNPSLKNVPMAVGGWSMLSTSNYIARKFGVRSGMPGFIGKKLCPNLVIVPANFDKYRHASMQVRNILIEYDPDFCSVGLDEAFLDITAHLQLRKQFDSPERTFCYKQKPKVKLMDNNKCGEILKQKEQDHCEKFGFNAEEVVREIRFRIEQETQLTASAGIATNTMLAKTCSDINKPNGQYRIEPKKEDILNFLQDLPICKVSGIGRVTEQMLTALGIKTCEDIYHHRALIYLLFSKISSNFFLKASLGVGSTSFNNDSTRKSISIERTFNDISQSAEMYSKCHELCNSLAKEAFIKENLKGRTVTIKLKTITFEVITRSSTLSEYISGTEKLFKVAKELLKAEINSLHPHSLKLRLMGIRLSGLLTNNGRIDGLKQQSLNDVFKKQRILNTQFPNKQEIAINDDTVLHVDKPNKYIVTQNYDSCINKNLNISSTVGDNISLGEEESLVFEAVNSKIIRCPVCNQEQTMNTLISFNHHIDICLNKSVIKNILKEEIKNGNSSNKIRCPSSSYRSKNQTKPKKEVTSTPTLDKFLK